MLNTPNVIKAQGPSRSEAKDQTSVKRPSKIFTDYYGSVFLILIALNVAIGFFFIKPKIDVNKRLDAQTKAIRQEVENDRSYFDGLSRSVAAAQSIGTEVLEKVDLALPRTASIPILLIQLNAAAQAGQVTLSNLVFESTNKAPGAVSGLQSTNITLAVTAKDYSTFKNFLHTLETSLRLFDIQTVSVGGFEGGKISFSLLLKSYYYPTATIK